MESNVSRNDSIFKHYFKTSENMHPHILRSLGFDGVFSNSPKCVRWSIDL